jgi:TetR/AcrR family transcriptional repressor of nem operon
MRRDEEPFFLGSNRRSVYFCTPVPKQISALPMARPQEFDFDDVLQNAMLLFWQKGYDDTSIQDLVEATGLNRGSLYNAFGDKAQLFAQVMERYRSLSPARTLAAAPLDASSRQLIADFLNTLVERAELDPDHKGCLLTNTAAGLYGCNDTMAAWVRETIGHLEDVLTEIIQRGQDRGELSTQQSAKSMAHFLVATAQGLNVMARATPDIQTLKDIVANALRALDPH